MCHIYIERMVDSKMSIRSTQLKSMATKAGVSAVDLRPSSATFIAERLGVLAVAQVYTLVSTVAGLFEKPVENDLDLLAFEMQALSSFMSLVEFEPLEEELSTTRLLQNSFLLKMHEIGFQALDNNASLRAECDSVNRVVTEFVAKIHALYRERVRLANVL